MRWDERIDAAEARGYLSAEDNRDLGSWYSCLVGEALSEAGAVDFYSLSGENHALWVSLLPLGGSHDGSLGPVMLARAKGPAALRARLAEIREVVAQHYPPPKLWEPFEQPAEPAKVSA